MQPPFSSKEKRMDNSRKLNRYTKRVEFPLPNIDTILDTLGESKKFSALDLAQGYHQVRIHEPDIHKTALKPQCELFEFTVLPFGLTAAPSTFQRLMNHVLQPHEKNYVICCLNDILINSKIQEDPFKTPKRNSYTLSRKQIQTTNGKNETLHFPTSIILATQSRINVFNQVKRKLRQWLNGQSPT